MVWYTRASIAYNIVQSDTRRGRWAGRDGARRALSGYISDSNSAQVMAIEGNCTPPAKSLRRSVDEHRSTSIEKTVCTTSNRHHAQKITSSCASATYFYPLQVDWVHNGALKEFHSGKVSLEQAFELQVGRFPVINALLTLRNWYRTVPACLGPTLPCKSM